MITTIVNVFSTPVAFWAIERIGRRPLLLWGALGMVICQFIVAIIGVTDGQNPKAVSAMISFICIYIFFFASTWGPGAWVVIGEVRTSALIKNPKENRTSANTTTITDLPPSHTLSRRRPLNRLQLALELRTSPNPNHPNHPN